MTSKTYEGYTLSDVPQFPAQKRITSVGSGSVPKPLRGMYTSFKEAQNAIDAYQLDAKRKKADAKADTAAGDDKVRPRATNRSKSAGVST